MKLSRSIAAAALIVFALTACHHAQQKRPVVDPQLAKLTKEQAFQKGEEQYAKKKYQKARTYFSYIFENFPNDPFGRRALLRVADSYFAAYKLTISTVKFESYPGLPDGVIIRQYPLRGAPVSARDAITVVVTRQEQGGIVEQTKPTTP